MQEDAAGLVWCLNGVGGWGNIVLVSNQIINVGIQSLLRMIRIYVFSACNNNYNLIMKIFPVFPISYSPGKAVQCPVMPNSRIDKEYMEFGSRWICNRYGIRWRSIAYRLMGARQHTNALILKHTRNVENCLVLCPTLSCATALLTRAAALCAHEGCRHSLL